MRDWDGYPADRTKSRWYWLGQAVETISPAYWDAERQIWTQGGICCRGSITPEQMIRDSLGRPVQCFGKCPMPH